MHWTISLLLLSTACQCSHVIEEVGEDDKSHLTEYQKEKLMDIISKYDHHSTKLATTEIIKRLSQCVRIFNKDETKGRGWTSTTSPTCVSVGQPCTGDWRNLTDVASHLSKVVVEKEKGGVWSSHTPGWNLPPSGWTSVGVSSSTSSKTCCNQDMCTSGYCCTPTPAYSNHSVCTQDSHCCGYNTGKSICDTITGVCKLRLGANCAASNQCINGNCNVTCCIPAGTCQPLDSMCTADYQCCNGTCADGKCMSKQGFHCCVDSDCTLPATCISNICTACGKVGDMCTTKFKTDSCCSGNQCVGITCRKQVTTGMCSSLNDLCVPPGITQCNSGVCCTLSGRSCEITNKCCTTLCPTVGAKVCP